MIQELRLKNIDEKRYHFYEEIKQKKLMSRKPKSIYLNSKLYWTLSSFYPLQLIDVFQFLLFLLFFVFL